MVASIADVLEIEVEKKRRGERMAGKTKRKGKKRGEMGNLVITTIPNDCNCAHDFPRGYSQSFGEHANDSHCTLIA